VLKNKKNRSFQSSPGITTDNFLFEFDSKNSQLAVFLENRKLSAICHARGVLGGLFPEQNLPKYICYFYEKVVSKNKIRYLDHKDFYEEELLENDLVQIIA
jgi:hypothetical protein